MLIKLLIACLLIAIVSGISTAEPLQWWVQDAIERFETGDALRATEQYKKAVAVNPLAVELNEFPIGYLPLELAGDVLVYHLKLLFAEPQSHSFGWELELQQQGITEVFIEGQSVEVQRVVSVSGHEVENEDHLSSILQQLPINQSIPITIENSEGSTLTYQDSLSLRFTDVDTLPLIIQKLTEYGAYAAAGGHYQLAEKAALAIEKLYYQYFNDPGLDLNHLQAAPYLLRALARGWQQGFATAYTGIRGVHHNIEQAWDLLKPHMLRYPEYWHPLFFVREEVVSYLPLKADEVPGGYYPADWQKGNPYPNLEGYIQPQQVSEFWRWLEDLEEMHPEEAAQLYWEQASKHYQNWILHREPDDFEAALANALAVTELDPSADAWFLAAQLLAELKDDEIAMELAVDALIRTLDLAPNVLEAQLLLGQVLFEQGRFFSSAEQFKLTIAQHGEEVVTGLIIGPLALAYAADDRVLAGITYLDSLLQEYAKPCIRLSLAVLHRLNNDFDSSFAHLYHVINDANSSDDEKGYAELLIEEYQKVQSNQLGSE